MESIAGLSAPKGLDKDGGNSAEQALIALIEN